MHRTLDQRGGLPRTLDRLYAPDERDKLWRAGLVLPSSERTSRYWYDREAFLDQGQEGACVGFGWTHWLNDGPYVRKGYFDAGFARYLYYDAQHVDEWEGNNYSGTSVRAGVKVLQARGYVTNYVWAFTLEEVVQALLEGGPVVVGTNWYDEEPDEQGFIHLKPTSKVRGGHAYIINGVNVRDGKVRAKNSWGQEWGVNGRFWMTFETLERLIHEDGEACLAVENTPTLT